MLFLAELFTAFSSLPLSVLKVHKHSHMYRTHTKRRQKLLQFSTLLISSSKSSFFCSPPPSLSTYYSSLSMFLMALSGLQLLGLIFSGCGHLTPLQNHSPQRKLLQQYLTLLHISSTLLFITTLVLENDFISNFHQRFQTIWFEFPSKQIRTRIIRFSQLLNQNRRNLTSLISIRMPVTGSCPINPC